jgi:hypothetical protein
MPCVYFGQGDLAASRAAGARPRCSTEQVFKAREHSYAVPASSSPEHRVAVRAPRGGQCGRDALAVHDLAPGARTRRAVFAAANAMGSPSGGGGSACEATSAHGL